MSAEQYHRIAQFRYETVPDLSFYREALEAIQEKGEIVKRLPSGFPTFEPVHQLALKLHENATHLQ